MVAEDGGGRKEGSSETVMLYILPPGAENFLLGAFMRLAEDFSARNHLVATFVLRMLRVSV